MAKRIFTVCRLLVHWSTGAAIGSIMVVNHWNKWTTIFTVTYLISQIVGLIINPYKSRKR
jgi:hypothetical protein